ncbi:MAG: MoxR family ATPase [Flavobacteriales bacterium]|jgi:MoxR-like ATPase|nr:MoxR family ATPase [Flavobacteriales bacterium]MBK6549469.1 MoxR family ATPase [Flavobacteriales bacterium]MBK6883944.1 MoxR family ATPase [Flavobacteriales bacterium]MBK7100335.1 MoxR family ATPase [Flavobacteriales bacterium]MBK7111029.1 MoxR family ATPase [Flavobacteriales bacterium]
MEETISGTPEAVTSESIRALNERIQHASAFVDLIDQEMGKVIVGQKDMVQKLLVALLADGHILLEGVPGLAKTMAIKTLSQCIDVGFSRIQFTPDLLPADLIGTLIYSQRNEEFSVKKGPIFSNFVLADEINRAPAKVQSALLEAMQERQVTIGATTYPLPQPFLVMATMNPIEQEGTYPLPEAQTDRFMLKVVLDYPRKEEEKLIIRQNVRVGGMPEPQYVVSSEQILAARKLVREVYMDEKIEQYIVDIVYATRKPDQYKLSDLTSMIGFGGSPRASINMALAAKALAFTKRRGYVIPEDVRAVCPDVLRHRIGLTYEAEAENITVNEIIDRVLNTVEVP